jgi:hypothetical protein
MIPSRYKSVVRRAPDFEGDSATSHFIHDCLVAVRCLKHQLYTLIEIAAVSAIFKPAVRKLLKP